MLKDEKNIQEHIMSTIKQLHEKMTLRDLPVKAKDPAVKNDYLTLLTAVAGADRDFDPQELQYLKSLALSLKLQTIELYHNLCAKMTVNSLEKKVRSIKKEKVELYLLLDALILASLDGPISDPESQYIGLLCDCLSIKQIDAKDTCTLAKAILQRDLRILGEYLKGRQPINPEIIHGTYLNNILSLEELQEMRIDKMLKADLKQQPTKKKR